MDAALRPEGVPYTIIVSPRLQRLGNLDKTPDAFCSVYRESLRAKLKAAAQEHGGDPWNPGVFTGNEMRWGKGPQLSRNVLDLDRTVPAKHAFIEFARQRHKDLEALNAAWGSNFPDFESVQPMPPRAENRPYREDLEACLDQFADTYFELCRSAMQEFLPAPTACGAVAWCRAWTSRTRRNDAGLM